LGIDFPNLRISATLFFSVFVGYAIVKYDLFTLDVSVASAPESLKNIAGAV